MKIPWILHLGAVAPALPLVVATRARTLSPGQRWILSRCGFLFAMNLVSLLLALQQRNNLWMIYLVTPIAGGMALWALALWQRSARAAAWLRLLVPLLGTGWIAIVLMVERLDNFSLLAEPFAGLLVLGAGIYTLIANTIQETGNLGERDWFWITIGLALTSAGSIALPPTSRWLLETHPDLVARAYQVKALLEVGAYLAIAKGVASRAAPMGVEGRLG